MADQKVCINFENCKANNGNIVILKGEEKPSCVVCSANKTFN